MARRMGYPRTDERQDYCAGIEGPQALQEKIITARLSSRLN
jgi:hypothetical protein